MKKFGLGLLAVSLAFQVLAASDGTPQPFAQDSIASASEEVHFPSNFHAQKLETAIKLKYWGLGLGIGSSLALRNGNNDLGLILALTGLVMHLGGNIGQDVQIAKLGWKHQKRHPRGGGQLSSEDGLSTPCSEFGFSMGDQVSFLSASGQRLTGEVVGIISTPSDASGCQIIVRYEIDGEFKTSTLAPTSLTKA